MINEDDNNNYYYLDSFGRYTSIPTHAIDSNGYTTADLVDSTLPPLKLPNMNVAVDMMTERAMASRELSLDRQIFELQHPSLFAWDGLEEIQHYKGKSLKKTNDMHEDREEEEEGNDKYEKNYIDMQVLVL